MGVIVGVSSSSSLSVSIGVRPGIPSYSGSEGGSTGSEHRSGGALDWRVPGEALGRSLRILWA